MNEDDDALSVGFEIDFRDSFGRLRTLEDLVGDAAANMYRQFKQIEDASGGAISPRSIAQVRTLTEGTREFSRERSRAEKVGEGLSRQLTRMNAEFGKSKTEILANKIQTAALAAEQTGLAELSGRLSAQQAALTAQQNAAAASAAAEGQAMREAAQAHQLFEARARSGIAAMREQEQAARAAAAAEADLAARAQRLIESVNPAVAAQNRFNAEMAEARALISAGAISLDDYAAKLRMERAALDVSAAGHGRAAASAGAMRQATLGASYQVQDLMTQISMGQNPINALAVQGAQLAGQFANIEGKAGSVARFFIGPWGLAITGAILLVGMLTKGFFDGAAAAEAKEKAAKDLDTAINQLAESTRRATQSEQANMQQTLASAAALRQKALDARAATIEQMRLTRATLAANLAQANRRDGRGDGGGAAAGGSGILAGMNANQLRELDAELALREKQLATTEVAFRNAQIPIMLQKVSEATDAAAASTGRFDRAMDSLNKRFGANKIDQAAYVAEALRLEKVHNAEQKAISAASAARNSGVSADQRRAERLARESDAVEAQVKNLYALVTAYDVSGAAALVAEARVKAESDAIKKRGDIEAMVNEQVQVAIAQRVRDAAASTAGLREQARIQEEANARVAAGNLPAERAAQIVQDRLADLPLLQAAEAAQQRGLAEEARAATKALADQQAERDRARRAEEAARFNSAMASGADQLEMLREELRLVGATNEERARALALIKATQEARQFTDAADRQAWIDQQMAIADTSAAIERQADIIRRAREEFDYLTETAVAAGDAIARAFGRVGGAVGDVISVLAEYQTKQKDIDAAVKAKALTQAQAEKKSSDLQLQGLTALTSASKNLFKEKSSGYKAMAAAEKALAVVQLARTAIGVAEGAATMFGQLGVFAFPAIAAMIGVMASLGFASGGKSNGPAPTNEGTGTVLGDTQAKSESITRAIDQLREVDTLMLNYSRQMAGSLRTIEDNIAGFASLLVRNGDGLNASTGVSEGFKSNAGTTLAGIGMVLGGPIGAGIGALLTKIPIVGSILKGLFGTKTSVVGSGLYGGSQSLGDILSGGFDAQVYSDIKKKKKFFGISAGTSYSTQFGSADPMLENQFTLILKSFNDAILAAAGPLGAATSEIQQRLNGFVLNIGKIDLQGLTGEQIEEKLSAVFGAAADSMAQTAFPGIDRFQKVGEGLFETLVRVASTVEAVTASLDMLGRDTIGMSIDVKMALADQFDSVSDLTNAIGSYFTQFYTKEEQAAARMGQMASVFDSLGLTLPTSLASFRALVEAQDLNTAAGREAYAILLQLAPAFADLQSAMAGAKSAADIATERQDLERQMLELRGDTAALRALQLAKLDASNRALQQEIWAMQDAQAAAKAADELRKAWTSVGDSIMDEVRRIRGLTAEGEAGGYAALLARFNTATTSARGGDLDAAKSLPQLSQALLAAAADQAKTRAELDRIRAQIAASLELTNGLVAPPASSTALLDAAAASQPSPSTSNSAATSTAASIDELNAKTEQLRAELTAALATIAANTAKTARKLEDVTAQSGGDAISTVPAA